MYIDQNAGSGDWIKLGSYPFLESSEVSIEIINDGSATEGSAIVSDAVKFVYKGEISDIKDKSTNAYDNFYLSQNYPNPFNPSTTIKYSISNKTHPSIPSREGKERSDRGVFVTLKVYDILGKKVAALVNEKQKPGNYEVNWNPSADGLVISSGIYFYQLTAGNYNTIRKMILLK
jgi:hypothetical protein